MGGRRYRSPTVKQVKRGECQARTGWVLIVGPGNGREDVDREMVVREFAFVMVIGGQFVAMIIDSNRMAVPLMMDVLDCRSSQLLMPRLVRTPHHARHDKRADDEDKGEMAKHATLDKETDDQRQ